jgi:hypothetical protein
MIVNSFNAEVNKSGKNKRALVPLATVNRSFFVAATDIMWSSMHSISPYVRLLPPFTSKLQSEVRSGDILLAVVDSWLNYHLKRRTLGPAFTSILRRRRR